MAKTIPNWLEKRNNLKLKTDKHKKKIVFPVFICKKFLSFQTKLF